MKSQPVEAPMRPQQAASRRKSIRLIGHDYSMPGAYFITIVAYGRGNLFGRLSEGCFLPSEVGRWVESVWRDLPVHFPRIRLDDCVVMPNHFHAILWIESNNGHIPSSASDSAVGAELSSALGLARQATPSLSNIIQAFKSFSTREINKSRGASGPVWQRGFHDHIIRNPQDLENTRNYIRLNPSKWEDDEYRFSGEGGA